MPRSTHRYSVAVSPLHSLPLLVLSAALAAASLTGCAATNSASPTSTAEPSATATTDTDPDAAAATCEEHGGELQLRQPTYGTNNDPSTWVALGEPVQVCRFRTGEGDTATAIYVDPVTLHASTPTLAALAYLARHEVPQVAPANPAAQLCTDLGGARSYGDGPAGGGLVLADDPIDVVAVCVFADGSFIDEWGIAYYSTGTVRGADLAPMFKFDTTDLPTVFQTTSTTD